MEALFSGGGGGGGGLFVFRWAVYFFNCLTWWRIIPKNKVDGAMGNACYRKLNHFKNGLKQYI